MAEGRLRWGVISTARIGRAALIPAIQASRNGALLALASRTPAAARELAERAGIARHYGRYEDLLADPEIEAVYLPLPNSLHREWTLRALAAGKHVLCEKPLALDEAECRALAAAEQAAGGPRLMEAFMYRFHPRTERVLQRLRSGEIGELRVIRSSFTFRLAHPANIRWDPALGGGALMDVGCYCVNLSRTMAGAEPLQVQASANWTERSVDRELVGSLHFPGGVLAHFDCALSLERNESYELAGTEGVLQVPDAFLPGKDDTAIHLRRGRAGTRSELVPGADEYQCMVEHFADCVRGSRPFRYPPQEAALNLRCIEALYRSAREGGRPVSL